MRSGFDVVSPEALGAMGFQREAEALGQAPGVRLRAIVVESRHAG